MHTLAGCVMLASVACGRPQPAATSPEGAPEGPGAAKRQRVVLQHKGSDTLVTVAQAWAEAYKDVDPTVAVAVTGGGSGVGITALIHGTADLASSSRTIEESELAMAMERGVEPVQHIVGHDALAIFLHQRNPLREVTLEQLAEVYGEGGEIDSWSQLGVAVPGCASDEIIRISRQNNSGTYIYFRKAVLGDRTEYALGSRDMHGSKDVVDLVGGTPCAIGYGGLAYANEGVTTPCVRPSPGEACVAPSVETAEDHSYPITRPLFMYTAGQPTGATRAYLDWILSDAGQCILLKRGYAPAMTAACE